MEMDITRIGKSAKGSVIHIVIDKNNRALCEKKQVGLVVDPELTVEDVTCKKCMTSSVFKRLLADFKISKEIAENKAAEAADKKASEEKIKEIDAEELKKAQASESKESFYKKKLRTGDFKIIHKASGKTFFSNIEEEVVTRALNHLNEIEERWASKHDKIPKEYIPKCRAAVALAYQQSNVTLPTTLENKEKEADSQKSKGRTIKRREGKQKTSLKKKKSKGKKSNAQKLLDFVIEKMHEGISLTDLTESVTEEFELSSKKGAGKVKKAIRRLRKKDIIMTIETRKNKNNDIYTIETV